MTFQLVFINNDENDSKFEQFGMISPVSLGM